MCASANMTVPWRGGRGCCSAYLVQICEVFYRSDHSSALYYPSNFLLYISLSSKLSQLGHNVPPETSVFEMTSYLALFSLLATTTLATLPALNHRRINFVNSVPAARDAHLRLFGRGG
jgi:hypothetical protein